MSRIGPFGRVFLPRRALPHRVDVYRALDVDDDAGGRIPMPSLWKAGLSCWVQPLSVTERLEFAKFDQVYSHRVVFFDDPGVLNGDLLFYGQRRLAVTGDQNELEVDLVWTVMCNEVSTERPRL